MKTSVADYGCYQHNHDYSVLVYLCCLKQKGKSNLSFISGMWFEAIVLSVVKVLFCTGIT